MTDLSDLRKSVNETARVARGNLLLLLVVSLYVAIPVAGTDDLLLLKRGEIALPLMQVSVPVDLFYTAAPAILLLLHFNLFLRLGQLSQRAGMLRDGIEEIDRIELRKRETALLFPFEFLQLLMYRTSRGTDKPEPPIRPILARLAYENEKFGNIVPLLALVGLVVFILPLGLLISMQARFLPYQHEAITLFQQVVVTLDVVMQAVFLVYTGFLRNWISEMDRGSSFEQVALGFVGAVMTGCFLAPLLLVWAVSVIPGSWQEKYRPFDGVMSAMTMKMFNDWWIGDGCEQGLRRDPGFLRRFLYVPGRSISAHERPDELIAAFLLKGEDPDRAWEFVDQLDLTNRSFRYGWFESAEFRNADLSGSDLHCARLAGAKLQGAILNGADMHLTDFRDADLANARLESANTIGADFQRAKFTGANAHVANFVDVDLRHADLTGADFSYGKFTNSRITNGLFHGTDLEGREFIGVDVEGAEFFGTNMKDAEFRGTTMRQAQVFGATLDGAEFIGSDLTGAEFYRSGIDSLEIRLTDLRRIDPDRPDNWSAVLKSIEFGLRERGLDESTIRDQLDAITRDPEGELDPRISLDAETGDYTWTDRKGSFEGRNDPQLECVEELAKYLVELTCKFTGLNAENVIAHANSQPKSWLQANNLLAFIRTDQHQCPRIWGHGTPILLFSSRQVVCCKSPGWRKWWLDTGFSTEGDP